MNTGKAVVGPLRGHAAISPLAHGYYILSGSTDSTVQMWDAETGEPSDEPFQEHTDRVNAIAVSSDGKIVSVHATR